jgi:hypothetical protein
MESACPETSNGIDKVKNMTATLFNSDVFTKISNINPSATTFSLI